MKIEAKSVKEYFDKIPEERKSAMNKLRKTILDNLPEGYEETLNHNMPGYVIPHTIYPNGYHCNPKLPLPFINIASQKNFIAFYHIGIYANPQLLSWFKDEYSKVCTRKLGMGKAVFALRKPIKSLIN